MKGIRLAAVAAFLSLFVCAPLRAEETHPVEETVPVGQTEDAKPSVDGAPVPAEAPAQPAAPAGRLVWLDDVVPANGKTDGPWEWNGEIVASGEKSHGHPSAKGAQKHGFTGDAVVLPEEGMLTQQVWLDPKDPPKGIMLKFKLGTGEEVGVYWEGEEEVFLPAENEQVWYYGLLPELGKWSSLEVLAEDLGLSGEKLTGISFITYDGRALWDKTEISAVAPLSEDEPIGQVPAVIAAPSVENPSS